jgi:hypothetical protein
VTPVARALRCARLLLEPRPPRAGRVLAVHARSLLLERDADPPFLWLLAPGLSLAPRACTCSLDELGARAGVELLLELEGAELWDPLWHPRSRRRLALPTPSAPLSTAVQGRLDELGRQPADPARLAALLGLGEGSTPEGDDVLAGLRAAWQLRTHLGDAVPLALLDELLDGVTAEQTHPLSLVGLRDARAGLYPEALARVLDAIGGEGELGAALDGLAALGGSSGRAIAWGLWLGGRWPRP